MTAKLFLFEKGITDDPSKALFVKREDMEFNVADLMEEYRSMPASAELKTVTMSVVQFRIGMQTGYISGGTYYTKTGPVPRSMDRQYAVMTTQLGAVVISGADAIMIDSEGKYFTVIRGTIV